jgi:uncharacterized protein YndB with AHSA1/START domain
MYVDVTVEAVIPFPRERVAHYAGDPSNAPEWYANIESVRWRTSPPVTVGSRLDFQARFLGRRMAYTYTVVELVDQERLVMRAENGPFPMETTYTWRSVPEGTNMTMRNRGTPTGFARVATPVMRKTMKAAMTKDLAHLSECLGHD